LGPFLLKIQSRDKAQESQFRRPLNTRSADCASAPSAPMASNRGDIEVLARCRKIRRMHK
jgi:hypothetical protein